MTKNLTELAQAAIDALQAYNAEYKRKKQLWDASRYGKHFAYNSAYISDDQHIALLTEIIEYDEDPAGTLQELAFEFEHDASANEADYRYEEMRSNEMMINS
jgi:uncharacterized protein (DUF1919 family)